MNFNPFGHDKDKSHTEQRHNAKSPAENLFPWEIVSGILIIIALALMSWIALGHIGENTREDIREELVTVMNETRGSLRIWGDSQKHDAGQWASLGDMREIVRKLSEVPRNRETLLASPAMADARNLLKHEMSERGTLGFFIIAPDYVNLASMRNSNVGVTNLLAGEKDYLEKVFKGRTVLTTPVKSDAPLPGVEGKMKKNTPAMFVIAPVFDIQGAVMAALAFRIDPHRDFNELARLAHCPASCPG